jgi:hypothetical protein
MLDIILNNPADADYVSEGAGDALAGAPELLRHGDPWP